MKKWRLWLMVAAVALLFAACAEKHTHKASPDWKSDAGSHWHPCLDCEEGVLNKEAHAYDNDCDGDCNVCGAKRTPKEHVYDHNCDADCNVCKAERIPAAHQFDNIDDLVCNVCGYERQPGEHIYDHACDADCNLCGAVRIPGDHVYDNACDADCNICKAERVPAEHVYDHGCDATCNVCGAERTPEAHVFAKELLHNDDGHWQECLICGYTTEPEVHRYDQKAAHSLLLKKPATADSKALYYISCACGERSNMTFESDKKPANIQNIQNVSKTYDNTPVALPTYEMDGDGAVTIQFKRKGQRDIFYNDTAPIEAGEYQIRVQSKETANYAGETKTISFFIAKKQLTGIRLNKTYDGLAVLGPVALTPDNCEGIVPGDDVVLTLALDICDVGAKATAITAKTGADSANYSIVLADVTAKVKPRAITGTLTVKTEYTGYRTFSVAIPTKNNRVEKDTLIVEILADSRYPGQREVLSVKMSPNQSHNYTVKNLKVKLEVTPKEITVQLPDTLTKLADGEATFEYDVPYGYLCANDKLSIRFDIPDAAVGTYEKVKPANIVCSNDSYTVKISNKSVTVVVTEEPPQTTPEETPGA